MAESDPAAGLVTAIDLLMGLDPAGTAARAAEQLALLPTPAAVEEAREPRGPGRPPGARNRSTSEWVDYIANRYRDPRLFLAEAYSRPAEGLARELGCTRLEAFQLQVKAAEGLLPYMAQKQPAAIQISAAGEISLVLVAPQATLEASGDTAIVIEQNQGDSE